MKSLPRIGCQVFRLLLLAEALGAGFGLAQSPASPRQGSAVILRSVKVISDAEGPAVEILTNSSQTLNPTIETLESPP
ncbi:MAG TPA: hypothetical protein VEU94_08720, partial [Terriglobales bacterium]|nr:hypothetical protein [Terriglobales bacterium]